LLAGLTLTGHATVWEVYVIAGITGMITVLDTPVRQAFTIQMVGRDELPNAVALNSSLFNASRIVGPAIAGGLIAVAGVGICFLINALSYLAVLAALWLMRVQDLFPVRKDQRHQNLLRGSLEGLRFAWRKPVIRSVSEIALAPLAVAWAAGLALVVTGIAFTLYSSQANATLQLAVTDQMRGRVLGIYGYV